MTRILHFSDTHLGYQAFDKVTPSGVNAREQDVYDAFERVVERILDLRPQVVVHSGDFFHRPSPSNRALTFGLEQLRRIAQAGIPTVIIAGNHETPKTVYNSPILRALRSIDGIYPFFGEQWEYVEIGEVAIHGVPHINDSRLLQAELARMEALAGKFNILLLHTSLGKRYLMEEYGEQIFPQAFEGKLGQFQYVALGHWHDSQRVGLHPCAWYSGSTERFSDTEIGAEKGFLVLELDEALRAQVRFEAIATRPWLRWERAECHTLSVDDLVAELAAFAERQDTRGAILSVHFYDIRPEQTLEISNLRLRQIFPDAFQVLPKRRTHLERSFVRDVEVSQFDSLDQIFADYVRSKYAAEQPALAERLVERAKHYFELE
ncbi:MAG TPA: exonuclease SbcCD subunit D [Saprospiraceae bacterium]|nr:exonuclease SbcCD subunit D [Saprospiraceae bacterium]HND86941.1 exonuclease SbcCD subunit D [Saprospiraceae bacterium]HNG90161.1 exonuclease SbcCD subunit D [Saprospiraceae bacterium]